MKTYKITSIVCAGIMVTFAGIPALYAQNKYSDYRKSQNPTSYQVASTQRDAQWNVNKYLQYRNERNATVTVSSTQKESNNLRWKSKYNRSH